MGVDDGVTSSKQKPETIYMSNKAISSHKNKIIQKPKLTHEKTSKRNYSNLQNLCLWIDESHHSSSEKRKIEKEENGCEILCFHVDIKKISEQNW